MPTRASYCGLLDHLQLFILKNAVKNIPKVKLFFKHSGIYFPLGLISMRKNEKPNLAF